MQRQHALAHFVVTRTGQDGPGRAGAACLASIFQKKVTGAAVLTRPWPGCLENNKFLDRISCWGMVSWGLQLHF